MELELESESESEEESEEEFRSLPKKSWDKLDWNWKWKWKWKWIVVYNAFVVSSTTPVLLSPWVLACKGTNQGGNEEFFFAKKQANRSFVRSWIDIQLYVCEMYSAFRYRHGIEQYRERQERLKRAAESAMRETDENTARKLLEVSFFIFPTYAGFVCV